MSMEHWPKGPDGQPEKAVRLEGEADLAAYGGIILSKLEAYGIPVFTNRSEQGEISMLYGGFAPTGVSFYVPESCLEDAKALLSPADDAE